MLQRFSTLTTTALENVKDRKISKLDSVIPSGYGSSQIDEQTFMHFKQYVDIS